MANELKVNVVNMSGLMQAYATCAAAGLSAIVLGPPGIGKTQSARQYAKLDGRHHTEGNAMLMMPEDVSGVLYPGVRDADGRVHPISQGENRGDACTISLRPALLPTQEHSMLVLDDFTNAPPAMQQVFYQLALERRAGAHALPDDTLVVLFGNRPSDKSGATAVNPVLANRCMVIEYEGPSWEEWDAWAESEGVHPDVRGYIAINPANLSKFDGRLTCNPTPRSWDAASRVLSRCAPDQFKCQLAGVIGNEQALKFAAFRDMGSLVTPWETIVADPKKAKLPPKERMDAIYFSCGMMATRVDVATFAPMWEYLKRFDAEFKAIVVRLAQARLKGDLVRSPAFREVMADREISSALTGQ